MSEPAFGPIFVTGATGYLGHELVAELRRRGQVPELWGRAQGYELEDPFELDERVRARLERARSEDAEARPLLLHLGGESRWGRCESEPERAWRVNAESTAVFSAALANAGGRLVYVSTDLVFDGEHSPYEPGVEPRPTSTYGRTKRAGEWYTLGGDAHLVVRLPLLYGPSFDGQRGASDMVLRAASAAQKLRLFVDEWRTPLHVRKAAAVLVDLALRPDVVGVTHPEVEARTSRWELGLRIAAEHGLDAGRLFEMASRHEMPGPARPEDCSLVPGNAPRA